MSLQFDHQTPAQRVRFGTGRAAQNLAEEIERIGAQRVLLISSGSQRETAERLAADLPVVATYTDVAMHVPVEKAEKARQAARDSQADAIVSIGGGSAVGTAKAIAMEVPLPIIAVPSTFAGSEGTNVWGMTKDERKTTGVDDNVLPECVVYDAELVEGLPKDIAVPSAMNAMAHCIDAMWGPTADPINQALALEGIRALSAGLRRIGEGDYDQDAREQLLYGAYLAAIAFTSAGSAMHHKICHVLGGTFGLPHAQTHAVVLPYVLAFNMDAAPEASSRIAAALGDDDALAGLRELYRLTGAPTALADLGMEADGVDLAVELSQKAIPESNPRPVTRENLTALLTAALNGTDPAALREPQAPAAEDRQA